MGNSLSPTVDNTFADAVGQMQSQLLQQQGVRDVANLGLTSLGLGIGARGAVGLLQALKGRRKPKRLQGPTELTLPYPVLPAEAPSRIKESVYSWKPGIPWYMPAMMTAGMAGLAGGWKATDALLDKRRRAEVDAELNKARRDFHDALLSQYDKPVQNAPDFKAASDNVMVKIGQELDKLHTAIEKTALTMDDVVGAGLGGYGMYGGLTGLVAGALAYDKTTKRSRRSILEKAMQRRQRRQFMQQPTEILVNPEPMRTVPHDSFKQEMKLLQPPAGAE